MCFRFLRLVLVCVALAACAPRVETTLTHVTEVQGVNCAVLRLANLPLTLDHGHLVVTAAINGAPVRLVVDTGAETLLLSATTVARLGLPTGFGRTRSLGIGGSTVNDNAIVDSFEFGGFRLRDRTVAVAPLKFDEDGLLGATFLAAFDVEIDLGDHRLTLWASKHCPDGFLPWSPPFSVVALGERRSGRIDLPIAVNDQALTLLFDTGAGITTLTDSAAARAGVADGDLTADKNFAQTGADGHPVAARLHRFAKVRIGTDTLNNVALAVAPLKLDRGLDGLLGVNYLRNRRVWIDYSDRRLYVQRSNVPEPFASPPD